MRIRIFFSVAFILVSTVALRAYALEISGVTIKDVTDDTATIEWHSDDVGDATINYGLNSAVGVERDPSFDKKDHTLTIENLDPSTTYYFRVMSTDEKGNKSSSGGFVLTTKSSTKVQNIDTIKDPLNKALAERIITDISKITDVDAIRLIGEKVKKVASQIIKPPTILGAPRITILSTSITFSWVTDRESGSVVKLVPSTEYTEGGDYTIVQGDSHDVVKKHVVEVIGLKPATEYHFILSSEDSTGLSGETQDDIVTTKALLPTINNIKVTRIQETSVVMNWSTSGVLARGVVEFTNAHTKATRSSGDPIMADHHSVQLAGLEFGSRYSAVIRATNASGDETVSAPINFVTVRDVLPPEISKVKNESTLFPSEDTKVQTIISWSTDEAASCQVFYTQGLVHDENNQGDALLAEANPLTLHTQVIVGFAPATVYKFWMKCHDEAGNESQSDDYVLITPIKEKNIIDIILENFQGTFGWVNNIGK